MRKQLNPTDYAEHRGCTVLDVLKAIQSGRILDALVIDCDVADRLWTRTPPALSPRGRRGQYGLKRRV
jgi:hypothetical protein